MPRDKVKNVRWWGKALRNCVEWFKAREREWKARERQSHVSWSEGRVIHQCVAWLLDHYATCPCHCHCPLCSVFTCFSFFQYHAMFLLCLLGGCFCHHPRRLNNIFLITNQTLFQKLIVCNNKIVILLFIKFENFKK